MTKIRCPKCGKFSCPTYKTITKKSITVRYRKCRNCKNNFKTVEVLGVIFQKIKKIKKISSEIDINSGRDTKQTKLKYKK